MSGKSRAKPPSPPRRSHSSPEVMRLVVMMYIRFPLSLRSLEDLLFERGIDLCYETVRMWWNRFGPMFASDIRSARPNRMRRFRHWRWHLDEVYERAMLRFRRMKTLQKFAIVHANVHNHFNLERHLVSRELFEEPPRPSGTPLWGEPAAQSPSCIVWTAFALD